MSETSVSGNLATYTATAILPANYSESLSGVSASVSGSLRALGTFQSRASATYTWTDSSNSWSNVGSWNLGNFAPTSGDSILMTNNGTIDLGGGTQTVVNAGAAGNGIVGTVQNGSLAFTGNMYVQSGTINVNLSNSGGGSLYIGGGTGALVYLGGANNVVATSGYDATVIGSTYTGAAGTVTLTNANALNAAGQSTSVYSGTLDLNGQTNVQSSAIYLRSGGSSSLVNNNTGAAASTAANIGLSDGATIGGAGNLTLSGSPEQHQHGGGLHQDRRRHAHAGGRQQLRRDDGQCGPAYHRQQRDQLRRSDRGQRDRVSSGLRDDAPPARSSAAPATAIISKAAEQTL